MTIRVTSFLFVFCCVLRANLPENSIDYATWESEMLRAVAAQEGQPPDAAIPKLGMWVMKLAMSSNLEKGDRPVFHAAQKALLSIPGYAEHYRNRILRAKAAREAADGKTEYGARAGDFRTEMHDGFQTLTQLPSPETVRVMGDFLFDDSVNPHVVQDNMREEPLSHTAVRYIARLPFASATPSNKGNTDAERDLPAWRQWYEQIKSGKRTFRFEGDPTEYDLNGPAPRQKLEHIARDRKRNAERATGAKRLGSPAAAEASPELGKTPKPALVAALVASSLLLAGAVWYFVKGHGKRA
jgi:hypothetical protein